MPRRQPTSLVCSARTGAPRAACWNWALALAAWLWSLRAADTTCSASTADATRFRAEQRFDAVIACFHVLNYMATPQALAAAFTTASAHLEPGGLFLFDSWHGPAVRAQGPETRVRDLVVEGKPVVRIAEPHHDPARQTVDVRYRFFIQSPPTKAWELIEETHHLRYLFREDIVAACHDAGFELVRDEAWLSGAPLDDQTWGACYVARRI